MTGPELDRPIFVVGAARSGTTFLARLLALHPQVAYLHEIKYIWRYRRPLAADDVRAAAEATPPVARYIRRKLAAFLEREGRSRLVEKSPSNCFRVPFIDAVFPSARYIHILRDGRDCAFSALRKWTTPADRKVVKRRLTGAVVPLRDAIFYLPGFIREVVGRRLAPGRPAVWGPRFPGLEAARRRHDTLEICALQWQASLEAARLGLETVDPERRLELRFEELARNTEPHLARALGFAGLDHDDDLLERGRAAARPEYVAAWRSRPQRQVAQVERLVGGALEDLGYG